MQRSRRFMGIVAGTGSAAPLSIESPYFAYVVIDSKLFVEGNNLAVGCIAKHSRSFADVN